jgi:hypothetical protein
MENIEYYADKVKAERVVLSQDEICWSEENITNE